MASAVISYSDHIDPNQAAIACTVTVALDGLLINGDSDLSDLATVIAMTDIVRQTCGMTEGADPFVNSILVTGETREVYSSIPAPEIPRFRVGGQ